MQPLFLNLATAKHWIKGSIYPPDASSVLIMINEMLPDLTVIGIVDNAEMWYSDGSHKAEPYKTIIVHVISNLVFGGGDTEFCDLRLAYRSMVLALKKELSGRIDTSRFRATGPVTILKG